MAFEWGNPKSVLEAALVSKQTKEKYSSGFAL